MSKKITCLHNLKDKNLSSWTVLSLFILKSETHVENGIRSKVLFTQDEEIVAVTKFSYSIIRDTLGWNIKPEHILALVRKRDGLGFCLTDIFNLSGYKLKAMTETSVAIIKKDRLYTRFKWSVR